jgi:hypothetical protein
MFKIFGGANAFKQWEKDQMLTNSHMNAEDKIVFRGASGKTVIMYAYNNNGNCVVNVPNVLLQDDNSIVINLDGKPECRTVIAIEAREKPEGYIYTESDPHTPANIEARVENLEKNGGGGTGGGVIYYVDVMNMAKDETPLYSDLECTAMVTREEFKAALSGGIGLAGVVNGEIIMYANPALCVSAPVSGIGMITIISNINEGIAEYTTFYTAEYFTD